MKLNYSHTFFKWIVLSVVLSTFLGGDLVSGGKMKEAGFENWAAPNTGATNESGFTALPNGNRTDAGLFIGTGFSWSCWASDVDVNNSVSLGSFDADLVFSSWAQGSVGQIAKIVAIAGDTLFLNSELRMDY